MALSLMLHSLSEKEKILRDYISGNVFILSSQFMDNLAGYRLENTVPSEHRIFLSYSGRGDGGSGNLFLRTLHLDGEPTFLLFLLFFFLCLLLLLFLLLAVGGGGKFYIVRFSSSRAIRKHTTVFLS